jgi:DNA-directed RNA polymerase II subunit RPB1
MYHCGYLEHIRKILRCVCFNCARLLYPRSKDAINDVRRVRYARHRFYQVLRNCEKDSVRVCDLESEGCGMVQPKFYKKGLGIEVEFYSQGGRNDTCSGFME